MSLNKVLNKILKENTEEELAAMSAQRQALDRNLATSLVNDAQAQGNSYLLHGKIAGNNIVDGIQGVYNKYISGPSAAAEAEAIRNMDQANAANEGDPVATRDYLDRENNRTDPTLMDKINALTPTQKAILGGGALATALGAGAGVMALRKKLRSTK